MNLLSALKQLEIGKSLDLKAGQERPYKILLPETCSEVLTQAQRANDSWNEFKRPILADLFSQFTDNTAQNLELLRSHNLEDCHWDWVRKTLGFMLGKFSWLCLEIDGVIQSIAIIENNALSRITQARIFYIEYLATAPWNRPAPNVQVQFKGLGTRLLKCCCRYSINDLKNVAGFSLHSLVKSESFYARIGMREHGLDPSKDHLRYFEMEKIQCEIFMNSGD